MYILCLIISLWSDLNCTRAPNTLPTHRYKHTHTHTHTHTHMSMNAKYANAHKLIIAKVYLDSHTSLHTLMLTRTHVYAHKHTYTHTSEPVVYFKESEVVVQESTTEEVHAQFTLLRNGTDLTKTTLVRYYWRIRDGDIAGVDEDFALFPSDSERCGVNRDGCVEFTNGQTKATLAVKVLPDHLLEGNESFHLSISVQASGRKGTPSSLRVTILDGERRKYIKRPDYSIM